MVPDATSSGSVAHLDAVLHERRRGGLGAVVQQAACRDLRGLDVGLVERVDSEEIPRDRRRVLPDEELRAERAADQDLAGVTFAQVELVGIVDQPHQLQIGRHGVDLRGHREQHHRQDPGSLLAGGFRDELLDPSSRMALVLSHWPRFRGFQAGILKAIKYW